MPSREFAELADRWGRFVRHVARTAFALRGEDGEWVLLYTFTIFSSDPIPFHDLTVETKSILGIRLVDATDAEGLSSALADPASIEVESHKLSLPAPGHNILETYHGLYLPRMAGEQRLPSIVATRQGTIDTRPTFPMPLALELELRACNQPYESMTELLSEFDVPIQAHDLGGMSIPRAEITLVPPAKITSAEIKAGVLSVAVAANPGIDPAKVRIGLKLAKAKGPQLRLGFDGEVLWKNSGKLLIGHHTKAVPEVGLAQIFLTYDNDFLGSALARDISVTFNARAAIHKAIDPGGRFAERFFAGRGSFEERVLLLLSLLNLDCMFYGQIAELTDGPDILAVSAESHLYVIECTTGNIDSRGKLRRLYERTNALRESLAESPYRPRELIPIMVTSLFEHETLDSIDEVRACQIALVCRERLEWWLSQIDAPPTALQFFTSIVEAIPSSASFGAQP